MNRVTDEKTHFLDYMELLSREFKILKEKYPELGELSHRELEVFLLLMSDKTQKQIAEELFVSASAIHFHTKNIYKKLSISGRKQLLIKYSNI